MCLTFEPSDGIARNCHAAVLNIATWAQGYFGKPLSFTTVCCYMKKCNLNIHISRRKLNINSMQLCCWVLWARAHLRLSKRQWKSVLYSDESTFQLVSARNGRWVLSPKNQKDHPYFHQWQRQKQMSVMVWWCSRANGMGDCHMCEGTIDMEAYIGILQRHILPSRWCISWEVHGYYIKTMPGIILPVLQWFLDRVNVLDWAADLSPIEKVWLIMKKRTDNNNNRQLNIWSLVWSKIAQKCYLQNIND